MSAEEILLTSEANALEHNQFVSNVTGSKKPSKSKKKIKGFGAGLFLVAIIAVLAFFFSSGNLIPTAISELLIEQTDVQYADGVESKKLVFQQALASGNIPDDTTASLKTANILVGYIDNGTFIENNKSGRDSVLKMDDQIITSSNFISAVSTNVELYNAFNNATYSRAAYYFDDSAQEVFKEIGTTRNNYTSSTNFDQVMSDLVGEGSNVDINSVALVEKTRINEETGEEETYQVYETTGGNVDSSSTSASEIVEQVRAKNSGLTTTDAALAAADELKVADTVSKEQRSSLFYLAFMENISKMQAGDGNDSQINAAMNYLYTESSSEVVDVETGNTITVTGTPLESPSLYAILSGSKVSTSDVANYSSDRILKTTENQLGLAVATTNGVNNSTFSAIKNTVASTTSKITSAIGRFISSGITVATSSILAPLVPTVSSSLLANSYDSITGIEAGEFLVEGAVNVGKKLAVTGSGATAGDADAVLAYQKVTEEVLAMDAAADRLNRSPFDITSKNTFLGSLVYKFAFTASSSTFLNGVQNFSKITNHALISLVPGAYAEDVTSYLTTYGECETYATIGAVGTAQCSEIATFDTSTLNNTFNDSGFINFVNENTTLNSDGTRTINQNSTLADFILYNNERKTPLGTTDGSILESVINDSSSSSFVSDILKMVKLFLGASDSDKRIATGAAFTNSSSNSDWQTYKYAQRYVSLARATAALRQYSDDETAYNNIQYFEGSENPVVAFLNTYYNNTSVATGN